MVAARTDFTIQQGEDFSISWIRASGLDANGDPIVIPFTAGTTAKLQARRTYTDPVALIDATTENDLLVLDEVAGKITFLQEPALTVDLPGGESLVWDIYYYPGGDTTKAKRWQQGRIFIAPDVTQE